MSFREVIAGHGAVIISIKNRLSKGAKTVQKDLDRLGQKMNGLGRISAGMGLAVAAPLGYAVKKFADFDDAMRAVGAMTTKGNKSMEDLTETAKELGRTTSFTATEVAGLMGELGRAGFNTDQVDAMTESVLALSRATSSDASMAAGVMSATIKQFGLDAGEASRVADILTATANGSFNSLETLSESLNYAAVVAKDFNVPLEETAALLGTLGNVGIQGSNAGTALRRLLTITGAEAEKLKGIFGVTFVDAAGNARPLIDTLDEVAKATNSLGTAEKAAKFNEAFGLLGITGASAISKTATETKALLATIQNAGGVAEKTAEQMDAGLGGSFRKIMSAAEGVQLALGESLEKSLQGAVDGLTTGLGHITAFVEQNQGLVQIIGAASVGLVGLGGGLIAAGGAATLASFAVGGLITTAGLLTSPLAIATAAVGGLGYVLTTQTKIGADALQYLKDSFGPLVETVQTSIAGITAAIENGDMETAWKIATETMELIWIDATGGIQDVWNQAMVALMNAGSETTAQIGVLFEALGGMLESMLAGYESYYNKVYNKVVELGGDLTGVKTVGGQSGSAFESDFGGAKSSLQSSIAGVKEFGRNLTSSARGQAEERSQAAIQAIADREQRRRELTTSISKTSTEEVKQADLAKAEKMIVDAFGYVSEKVSSLFGGSASGDSAEGSAGPPGVAAGGASAEPGQAGGATFSAFGAALLGMGGGSATDRTANATEKSVELLAEIRNKLESSPVGKAASVASTAAGSAIGSAAGMAVDFVGGIADAISRQTLVTETSSSDPVAKSTDESMKNEKSMLSALWDIAKNTKQPPAARYAE